MLLTVISGPRGSGKTTRLLQYVRDAAEKGRRVGGVAAPALGDTRPAPGYDLLDLRSGRRRPLARMSESSEVVPTIGLYLFDAAALAEGQALIIAAVEDGLDLIAIDEVGPLEWQGRGWAAALTYALAHGTSRQELVLAVRESHREGLPQRFPSPWWPAAFQIRLGMTALQQLPNDIDACGEGAQRKARDGVIETGSGRADS